MALWKKRSKPSFVVLHTSTILHEGKPEPEPELDEGKPGTSGRAAR